MCSLDRLLPMHKCAENVVQHKRNASKQAKLRAQKARQEVALAYDRTEWHEHESTQAALESQVALQSAHVELHVARSDRLQAIRYDCIRDEVQIRDIAAL